MESGTVESFFREDAGDQTMDVAQIQNQRLKISSMPTNWGRHKAHDPDLDELP